MPPFTNSNFLKYFFSHATAIIKTLNNLEVLMVIR